MEQLEKALRKLRPDERKKILDILRKLRNRRLENLDLKKLKGRNDIFRVRHGRIRIIYRVDQKGAIFVLAIERRSDTTYHF